MRSERVSVLCLLVPLCVGILALLAAGLDAPLLAAFFGRANIASLTALCLLLSAMAARCSDPRHRERLPWLRFVREAALALLGPACLASLGEAFAQAPGFWQAILLPAGKALGTGPAAGAPSSLASALILCLEWLGLVLFACAASPRRSGRAYRLLSGLACSAALLVALAGLAVLVSFLYAEKSPAGDLSLPGGLAFAGLGVGTALAFEGDPERGVWPLYAFFGPTMATKLLRVFAPLSATITLGGGSLFILTGKIFKGWSLAAVASFAFLSLLSILLASKLSREVGASIDGLIDERRRAEARLEDSLRAREALLAELNHRTRNSLQLVLGLLEMGGEGQGPSQVRERIAILAFIHDELSQGEDISALDSARFLEGLAAFFAAKGGVSYERRAETFPLLFDLAAPLGFVLADIDDSARAAGLEQPGRACLGLELREGGCRLEYRALLGRPLDISRLSLAKDIVEGQLGGSLVCESGGETRVSIFLGSSAYRRRI